VETALVGGWGLLLFAAVRLVLGRVLYPAAPACYIAATALACLLERRSRWRRGSPLTWLGLEAVSTSGDTPGAGATFFRLLLTPPSVLAGLAGYLPLLAGARPVPELLTGTMMLSLQPQLDPRPRHVMRRERRSSRRLVLSYSALSVAAALAVLLLPVAPGSRQRAAVDHTASGLEGEDARLLVYYLDNVQRYPDSLEFHVRLASLYYRNDMEADLAVELAEIRRLDPDHPMLLLGEDLSVDLEDLVTEEGSVSDSLAMASLSPGSETEDDGEDDPDSTEAAAADSAAAETTAGLGPEEGVAAVADSSLVPQEADTAAAGPSPGIGTEAEPSDTSATAEPSDTSATAEPSDTSATAQPSDTSATAEPSDTSATAEPSDTSAEAQPSDTSAEAVPSDTGAEAVPSDMSAEAEPSDTSAEAEPSDTGAEAEPSDTGATAVPSDMSAEAEPSDTGAEAEDTGTDG
jgi:hypothetical protein